jgi:hypothetical protein
MARMNSWGLCGRDIQVTTSGFPPFRAALGDIVGLAEPERLELAFALLCIFSVSANVPEYIASSLGLQTHNSPVNE